MRRDEVEAAPRDEFEHGASRFPDDGRYCIGNVPDTVRSVLDRPTDRFASSGPAAKP